MDLDKVIEAYNLTLEQQFWLKKYEELIEKVNKEELKELLLTAYSELYRKDNQIKQLITEKLTGK